MQSVFHFDCAERVGLQKFGVRLALKPYQETLISAEEWDLWVRPARLLALMANEAYLIAIPPAHRIMSIARQRRPLLSQLLGTQACLTSYPDEYQRGRLMAEFPKFYGGLFGKDTDSQSSPGRPVAYRAVIPQ